MYNKKINVMDGYYHRISYISYDFCLRDMPNASAGVSYENGCYVLISYETPILAYDENNARLIPLTRCTHSNTTRRHIGAFVREFCDFTYQIAKRCIEKSEYLDIKNDVFRPCDVCENCNIYDATTHEQLF